MIAAYVEAVVYVLQATVIWFSFIIAVLAVTLIAVVAAAVGLMREAAVAALRLRPAKAHAPGARITYWNAYECRATYSEVLRPGARHAPG